MTATECIAKFGLKLGEKNGVRGVLVTRKATAAEVATLKSLKAEIMEELEAMEAALAAERAERIQEEEAYARTANLKRCLVCVSKEYSEEWNIETLELQDGKLVAAKYLSAGKRRPLFRVTPTMEKLIENHVPFGFCAVAQEITAEEEVLIVAEQKNVSMDMDEAPRQNQKSERAEKIETAIRTGVPVEIFRGMVPCSDPSEECSADLMVEVAMPDGTVKTTRQHTW